MTTTTSYRESTSAGPLFVSTKPSLQAIKLRFLERQSAVETRAVGGRRLAIPFAFGGAFYGALHLAGIGFCCVSACDIRYTCVVYGGYDVVESKRQDGFFGRKKSPIKKRASTKPRIMAHFCMEPWVKNHINWQTRRRVADKCRFFAPLVAFRTPFKPSDFPHPTTSDSQNLIASLP